MTYSDLHGEFMLNCMDTIHALNDAAATGHFHLLQYSCTEKTKDLVSICQGASIAGC